MWTARRLTYVASGTISTMHLDKGQLPARLKVLFDGIREVVGRYEAGRGLGGNRLRQRQPAIHFAAGTGARRLRHGAGAILICRLAEYTALQMKQAVVGYGRAEKPRFRRWCAAC